MALQPQHANGMNGTYAPNYAANGFAPDPAASPPSDHHVIDIPEAHDPHMDRLLTPAAQAAGADERLRCRVSENRKGVVVLSIEEGNVFVLAAKQSGKDWLLGTEVDEHGNFGMRGVVAKMRAHKDGVFTCVRQRGGGHFAQHLGGGETLLPPLDPHVGGAARAQRDDGRAAPRRRPLRRRRDLRVARRRAASSCGGSLGAPRRTAAAAAPTRRT